MSKLRIEVLTTHTPYQTYLEERLQSARAFGWSMPARTAEPRRPQAERARTAPDLPVTATSKPA
ncbi:MAG TPA: hypothetical protein PKC12_02000 [Thiobacillaceae bacterium]|nr:hypothetical protein [Thiobacillaceae bacterium]